METFQLDPVKIEIYKHRFRALAEEMGLTLCRSAYSSNIKERKDFSCALFDAQGELVSQAEHLPVHLGSMPLSVQSALQAFRLAPGDSVILNDPFAGGTHLPDITMIDPVFLPGESEAAFFVANRAHHSDVGGMTPGSMPLSTDIFQEGLRIPPLKWRKCGELQTDLLALILRNVRTPQEREGDLLAQWAANQAGVRRLQALCQAQGAAEVRAYARQLQSYAETMMRDVLRQIPDGSYAFADALDDDGISSEPVRLQVRIEIAGDRAHVDFTGSAPQTQGCVNTIYAVTLSCVFYAFRCLLDPEVPSNAGCLAPIQVTAPLGSVVNACFPSAVVGGNVETSQRLVDVLFGALAQALPERIPAASAGSMNNLTIGGLDPRSGQPFSYYETLGGGMGARPGLPGLNGIQTHMTNTLNTPIEALELTYPFQVSQYRLRQGSGGTGQFAGGEGLVRELKLLAPAQVTLLSDRRHTQPYGLQGGGPGASGRNTLYPAHSAQGAADTAPASQPLPSKISFAAQAGDRLCIETPGGGGWGKSPERLP